ncbi:WhiB family transcriptional regulator [Actinacidiphila sp. DG2A-62]|uniref:WhiB family transcriptional regulator n=1 Tax=Actinacidiphila sp. DG2A-62 TaxID=3108821 RepID=UPI002DBD9B7E|nr:WhiB family transcriptional regulator [Actinacidiphila sp. DG2A-62]MEC3995065.1 WhiB family transcriptional regulator [Actinacidiphila sp. DG2A-62]
MSATTHWRLQAACADEDPELFFPEHSGGQQARDAKAVCATCPVEAECRAWAMQVGVEYGVWGGTSAADRRHQGVKPVRMERQVKPCGTQAAYDRHIKRGEPVDDECREANRLRQAARRAAKKAAAAAAESGAA